jgi:hypothetical protein
MAEGDAGNDFLHGILSFTEHSDESMTESKANAFTDGAKALRQIAEEDGWAVSEEGGEHFLKAVEDAQRTMTGLTARVRNLSQAPKLGEDLYATQVAGHMQQVLDSDEQSLLPVFHKFMEGLDETREAIKTAMTNFDKIDEAATRKFGSF